MNFKSCNSLNSASARAQIPTISFSTKGANRFSKALADAMGVSDDDTISIVQDIDNPDEWYIHKDENGFKVRSNTGGASLLFNCSSVARAILDAAEITEEAGRFRVGLEPTTFKKVNYFPIFLASGKE